MQCKKFEFLTLREEEVIRASLSGLPDKAVARSLRISLPTIRAHWRTIRLKTGLPSRMEVTDSYRKWQVAIAKACIAQGLNSGYSSSDSSDALEILSYLGDEATLSSPSQTNENGAYSQFDPDSYARFMLKHAMASEDSSPQIVADNPSQCICPFNCAQYKMKGIKLVETDIVMKGIKLVETNIVEEILKRFSPDVAGFFRCNLESGVINCAWAATSPKFEGDVTLRSDQLWNWFLERLRLSGACWLPSIRLLPEAATEEFRGLRQIGVSSCYFFVLGRSPNGPSALVFIGYNNTTILSKSQITAFVAESERPC